MEQNTTQYYQGIISLETRHIFELVLLVILTGLVCLFGIVSNILNMIIFYRQGLTTTMNISLFALALSDVFSVATMEWATVTLNPRFIKALPHWDTLEVSYLTAVWPHFSFERITCWITTYITAERCLCIAMPLKVKEIATPRRTTFIIGCIYAFNFLPMVPIYLSSYLDWVFVPERNGTLLTMVITNSRSVMESVAFVLHAVLGTASFPLVIVLTVILVHKLRRQRTWRMKSSSNTNQKAITSKREVQAMNMVVLIAVILIGCYTPGILVSLTISFVPSFNIFGAEVNLYISMWSFAVLFQATNSSVNIFLYYKMNSKYKQTFLELFCCYGRIALDTGHAAKQLVHENNYNARHVSTSQF